MAKWNVTLSSNQDGFQTVETDRTNPADAADLAAHAMDALSSDAPEGYEITGAVWSDDVDPDDLDDILSKHEPYEGSTKG